MPFRKAAVVSTGTLKMPIDRHGRANTKVESRGKKPCAAVSYRLSVAVFDSEARLILVSSRFGDGFSSCGPENKTEDAWYLEEHGEIRYSQVHWAKLWCN